MSTYKPDSSRLRVILQSLTLGERFSHLQRESRRRYPAPREAKLEEKHPVLQAAVSARAWTGRLLWSLSPSCERRASHSETATDPSYSSAAISAWVGREILGSTNFRLCQIRKRAAANAELPSAVLCFPMAMPSPYPYNSISFIRRCASPLTLLRGGIPLRAQPSAAPCSS
jgi:hypothetical protein